MRSQFSNRALGILVAASGMLMVVMGPGVAAGKSKPVTHRVNIDGTKFAPADVAVAIGDSIVWVNKDPYPHTATATSGGIDSPAIAPGKSWKYTAKKKGDYPYICTIHPSMTGTVHVK